MNQIARSLTRLSHAIGLLALASTPAMAQANTVSSQQQIPLNGMVLFACDNFEPVRLTGTLHVVSHTTWDANGNLHTFFRTNGQNVRAVGQITGRIFRLSGPFGVHTNHGSSGGFTTTVFNDSLMISQGSSPNMRLRSRQHITVNANGVVTSVFDNFSLACE